MYVATVVSLLVGLVLVVRDAMLPQNHFLSLDVEKFGGFTPVGIAEGSAVQTSCLLRATTCDTALDCKSECGSDGFVCEEVKSDSVVLKNGTAIPPGGKYCVPTTKLTDNVGDINQFTTRVIWTETGCPDGRGCWRKECKFPQLYDNVDKRCSTRRACDSVRGGSDPRNRLRQNKCLGAQLVQAADNGNCFIATSSKPLKSDCGKYFAHNKSKGAAEFCHLNNDVCQLSGTAADCVGAEWNPLGFDVETLQSNPMDVDQRTLVPTFHCDCDGNLPVGGHNDPAALPFVRLKSDPYHCHIDPCFAANATPDIKGQQTVLDLNTMQCDCSAEGLDVIVYGQKHEHVGQCVVLTGSLCGIDGTWATKGKGCGCGTLNHDNAICNSSKVTHNHNPDGSFGIYGPRSLSQTNPITAGFCDYALDPLSKGINKILCRGSSCDPNNVCRCSNPDNPFGTACVDLCDKNLDICGGVGKCLNSHGDGKWQCDCRPTDQDKIEDVNGNDEYHTKGLQAGPPAPKTYNYRCASKPVAREIYDIFGVEPDPNQGINTACDCSRRLLIENTAVDQPVLAYVYTYHSQCEAEHTDEDGGKYCVDNVAPLVKLPNPCYDGSNLAETIKKDKRVTDKKCSTLYKVRQYTQVPQVVYWKAGIKTGSNDGTLTATQIAKKFGPLYCDSGHAEADEPEINPACTVCTARTAIKCAAKP